MKILLVNKFHYLRGGDCRYVFKLAELLEKKGHEVRHFSMQHPKNFKYKYANDFVSHIDFVDSLKEVNIKTKINSVFRILYSKEARIKFRKVLLDFKPDIIHLNNIHKHLTTSIILEANKRHIPIVWTLHDYNLVCPNISFISNNAICEDCRKWKYAAPIKNSCSNHSFSASVIIAIEKLLHDIQGIRKRINFFIAPSSFLKDKFIEYKFPKKRIIVIPNFYELFHNSESQVLKCEYFLYLGRISVEKGVETLCEAAINAKVKLIFAGEGPLKEGLNKKYSTKNIKFVGHKSGHVLSELRKKAWFIILPSECYENNPYSIIESFADGVPAIGSRIGGIPELVKNDETGFLFDSGNVKQLEELLIKTSKLSIKQRNRLGRNAREQIQKNNNPNKYYKELIKIYNKSILEEKSKWKRQ